MTQHYHPNSKLAAARRRQREDLLSILSDEGVMGLLDECVERLARAELRDQSARVLTRELLADSEGPKALPMVTEETAQTVMRDLMLGVDGGPAIGRRIAEDQPHMLEALQAMLIEVERSEDGYRNAGFIAGFFGAYQLLEAQAENDALTATLELEA